MYPCVPGHEFVGKVTAVGDKVSKFKVGDNAGLGPIGDSCLDCGTCKKGFEQHCEKQGWAHSYNDTKRYGHIGGNKDTQTFGGYIVNYVHHEHFCVKLPNEVEMDRAGPLLCAGGALYEPLKHHGATDPEREMTVGIIGIGGLGTMGIKIAKALGKKVVAISHSAKKEKMALEKGADVFVNSSDPDSMKKAAGSCDLILNTVSVSHQVADYLGLLNSFGTIVQLGVIGDDQIVN